MSQIKGNLKGVEKHETKDHIRFPRNKVYHYPRRVWEKQITGKYASRALTKEDVHRRRQLTATLNAVDYADVIPLESNPECVFLVPRSLLIKE